MQPDKIINVPPRARIAPDHLYPRKPRRMWAVVAGAIAWVWRKIREG